MSTRRDLPSGTVTFLFTDVEGSTRLLHELGPEGYADALAEHRRVIRDAAGQHGGVEVDTQGDAFFIAFPTAPGALAAAAAMCDALKRPVRVRIGVHSGTPLVTDEGYVGPDVHRAARIAATGHGGQTLVSASTAALAPDTPLTDLGPHRLKDLSAPERIYQLGAEDFPPLKSLHQTNLPIAATPFLGREKELPEVLRLLSNGARLLTLTGPGGTGKTRLATQAAAMLAEEYPDGVWWVPLAPLRDPDLVLSTASQTLGAKNGLAEHIGDKSMLVLFDNFEQVVEAAANVASLLTSCPRLRVLVTSRERLQVTGEQEYPVPPLVHEEGVGFFLARARAIAPGFEPDDAVSEICRRLDDLPLALELAAARVKALSPAQMLERLDQRLPLLTGGARDLPERQRTLRATIEWSYELLNEEEQRLFAELGVFRGGCTLAAAEQVAGADIDALQSLIDKSLIRQRDERYWMLETIREFASELADDGARRRHAEHFLALAEEAEPHLRSGSLAWLDRLEEELDNIRASLDYFGASGETELTLRLAGALSRWWYLRGYVAEGRRRLDDALARDKRPTLARVKALIGAAIMALQHTDAETARHRTEEALDLARRLDDAPSVAYVTFLLGDVALDEGDPVRARDIFAKSVTAFRELGEDHYARVAMRTLAYAYELMGDLDRSRELHEENLAEARAAGDSRIQGESSGALGAIAVVQGRLDDARPLLEETHRIVTERGDRLAIATNLCRFATLLAARGKAAAAVQLIGCAERQFDEMGARLSWVDEMNADTLALVSERLADTAIAATRSSGANLSDEQALALALQNSGLAE